MIKFTLLKMTPEDYRILNPGNPLKTIVFQFMLDKQEDIYPKLRAYAMKVNHQVQTPSIKTELQYLNSVPSAHLSIIGKQVLGDLQVKISDLEEIIRNANPSPHTFTHLVLTPEIGEEEHVVYKISVVPTTLPPLAAVTLIANPSPPRGAA
jgi:hypothetical protein